MLSRVALLCSLTTLLSGSLCNCDKESVEVVGIAECVGCAQNNVEPSQALSGLLVAIICKGTVHGKLQPKACGELTHEGKFKVRLPSDMVMDIVGGVVQLKQQCLAQLLYNASGAPCPNPNRNGLEASNFEIVYKSTNNGKHRFSPVGNLSFSPMTCTSATNYELPKPKIHFRRYSYRNPNTRFYCPPCRPPYPRTPISFPPPHSPPPRSRRPRRPPASLPSPQASSSPFSSPPVLAVLAVLLPPFLVLKPSPPQPPSLLQSSLIIPTGSTLYNLTSPASLPKIP